MAHEAAQEGDENDIQGRDETGFPGRRHGDADLLQRIGSAQDQAAPGPAYEGDAVGLQLLENRRIRPICPFIGKEQDDRDEDDDGDDIAGGAEGKRTDIVHADALSDKGRPPDEGRNEQQYRALCL